MERKHCFMCGGFGFLDKTCPECGMEATRSSLNLDKKENVEEFVEKIKGTDIPAVYHGVFWNREILERDNKEKLKQYNNTGINDELFVRYCAQLEKINDIFASDQIPHKSAIIIAPAGYSKITFAYSCMQRALNAGFTVAPLLDTGELKRALILASENPKYLINKSLSYDDYILSDVMFITVTKLYTRGEAFQVIEEVFDRRSRKGLSTFIISRFNLEEMSRNDNKGDFMAIKKIARDEYKYPAIIQYVNRYNH